MNLLERIKQVGKEGIESNCHGTTLYLTGIIDEERFIESNYFKIFIKDLEMPIEGQQRVGDIIAFSFFLAYLHSGVIIETEPKLKIVHRSNYRGGIETKELEEYLQRYNLMNYSYFRPK